MRPTVHLIRTGNANLASVEAGLRRAGAAPVRTEDPEEVRSAEYVVLPGVGALGPTKARLDGLGLSEALIDRARAGAPLLAVCVGLQLLLEGSAESPGVPGLGLVPGHAERFGAGVRVPQLGWNRVEAPTDAVYLETGECYFANSYRLPGSAHGFRNATAQHGGPFLAGLERGALLACQFHPELSGSVGARILGRWLEKSAARQGEV